MTQLRVAHTAGRKCLAWLLVLAIALMGLTVTRQQVVGSLHSHADHTQKISSAFSTTVSNLASYWAGRWQQQNTFGHGKFLLGSALDQQLGLAAIATIADNSRSHDTHAHGHAHDHDSLERHHHAAHDASVIAVDGAAESAAAADSSTNGSSVLLPSGGAISAGLVLPEMTVFNGPWPVGRLVAFVSRSVPPLLRPPSL